MDDTLLPYLAGFFDGEGHVGVYLTAHKHYLLTITVTNTNKEALELFKGRFDGVFWVRKATASWRTTWGWKVQARKAEVALRAMQPWIIVKREEVDVALEFADVCMGWSRRGPKPWTAEERALRESYKQRLKDIRAGRYTAELGIPMRLGQDAVRAAASSVGSPLAETDRVLTRVPAAMSHPG